MLVRVRDTKRIASIAVMRYDKQGNPVNARPCPCCQLAISELAPNATVSHT